MSRQLIESIVAGDMLEASDVVNAKLDEIRACKMYEAKRRFASEMSEGVGGLTRAEIEARKKAGYRKASEVLGDPRKSDTSPRLNPDAKIVKKKISEDSLDEDLMRDIKRGIKRTAMRGKVMGYAAKSLGKELGDIVKTGAQSLGKAAAQKASDVISDPLPAASSAIRATSKGVTNLVTSDPVKRGVKKVTSDLTRIGFRNLD